MVRFWRQNIGLDGGNAGDDGADEGPDDQGNAADDGGDEGPDDQGNNDIADPNMSDNENQGSQGIPNWVTPVAYQEHCCASI